MGFRFRKSLNFGPFRLNLSKTGIGWSVGVPGARWTQRADSKQQTTLNIPGTGISHITTSTSPDLPGQREEPDRSSQLHHSTELPHRSPATTRFTIVGVAMIGLGALSIFTDENSIMLGFIVLMAGAAIVTLARRADWNSPPDTHAEATTATPTTCGGDPPTEQKTSPSTGGSSPSVDRKWYTTFLVQYPIPSLEEWSDDMFRDYHSVRKWAWDNSIITATALQRQFSSSISIGYPRAVRFSMALNWERAFIRRRHISPDEQLFIRLTRGLGANLDEGQAAIRQQMAIDTQRTWFETNPGLTFLAGLASDLDAEQIRYLKRFCECDDASDQLHCYATFFQLHVQVIERFAIDSWYEFAIPVRMDSATAAALNGFAALGAGDLQHAINLLDNARFIAQDWRRAVLVACTYERLGQTKRAIALLQDASRQVGHEEETAYVKLLGYIGVLALGLSDTDTAVDVLKQGLAKRRLSAQSRLQLLYALGQVYLAAKSYKKAVEAFSKAATIKYDFEDLQKCLGEARRLAGLTRDGSHRSDPSADSARQDTRREPWEVLDVARTAAREEVAHAYRLLMTQYHPDKVAHLGPELRALAEQKAKEINWAYEEMRKQQGW